MLFETTSKSAASKWMSLENLLRVASKNDHLKIPTVETERVGHASKVLHSKLGCDLLLDSNGILFPVHSAWILGGPSADWMLQIYNDFTRDMKSVEFSLEMIKFAEFLKYPALINAAYAKMIEQLLFRGHFTPTAMKDFVEWTYGDDKICKDEEGLLKHLIVAATLAHGYKHWDQARRDEFVGLIRHQKGFVDDLAAAEELNKTLSKSPQGSQKKEKKKKGFLKRRHDASK
ncbi:uncharacterized protein J4E87_005386 [Alternaria ethzedia]|uniref:uncharacterized protein n=1 Tax=Alternaria ethzedia TaxID=181014 RepID=UPI0020C3D7EE|nr:uncharacterized protein J4E87_005386 [Alternaria ethzedia]KAI4624905.1 hypothetical protein J4E87_005386 [Alternaria ethzedia]